MAAHSAERLKSEPSLEEALSLISKGLGEKSFIIIVGECSVEYKGRSSSSLGLGGRVVLIKPDSSMLIHRRIGYEPVNWQPPGCVFTTSMQKGMLVVKAARRTPVELLQVTFTGIRFATTFSLVDEARFEMFLTEEELHRVLFENPGLIEEGLRITSFEKEMKFGVADMVGFDKYGNYVIIEVKKDSADVKAVKQLYKYVVGLRYGSSKVRGIIAAPGMKMDARRLAWSLGIDYARINLEKCADLSSYKRAPSADSLDRHVQ